MTDTAPRVARRSWLPRRAWSRLIGALARSEAPWLRALLIHGFMRVYRVQLDECVARSPAHFRNFNAFFTRRFSASARPLDTAVDSIVSPCDGTVSVVAPIAAGRVIQAKGLDYSLADFVADPALATRLEGGDAITIYLSPRDYHRVHAPHAGRWVALRHAGTERFGVSPSLVSRLAGLYIRNERAVLEFDVAGAPLVLVMVGAVGVGSISTAWDRDNLTEAPASVAAGDEIGRFNLGSTVVMLTPPGWLAWRDGLTAGTTVRFGERIATRRSDD